MLLLTILPAKAQQGDNYRGMLANPYVQIDETNLPIIFIEVDGQMILRDQYILAHMKVIHNGDGQLNYGDTIAHPGQHIDYEGPIALRYRGNSSFDSSNKKPFQLRTLKEDLLPDEGGEKQKVEILGMGKDNKWCFIAPWGDKVMFRDVLTFDLARPWMDYVPTMKFCEVILDGTYYGVYAFGERISKGKHRLNLHDPGSDEGDLSGDYHVAVDRAEDSYYTSRYRAWASMNGDEKYWAGWVYQHKEPDQDDWATLPTGTRQRINTEIDLMESSFRTEDATDPEGGYRQYIDEQSFIDYLLSTEISNNIDGYRLSTHFYKYSETRARNEGLDPRWKLSLWDINLGWGNANYNHGDRTDSWVYLLNTYSDDAYQVPFYWYVMMSDRNFVDHVKQRYKQYREGNYSNERIMQSIDSLATLLTSHGAVDRNDEAWRVIGRYEWPNPFYGYSYEEDLNYMKQWTTKRLRFLDNALLPREPRNTTPILPLSGWNADVIVEDLPAADFATSTIDADRTFYSRQIREEGCLPSTRLVTSQAEGILYRLAAYTGPNAVSMHQQGQQATVTFDPFYTSDLWMLATSGSGRALLEAVVNYTDGTSSEPELLEVRDFSVPNPDGTEALTGLGNIRITTDELNSGTCHSGLFDLQLHTDSKRQIASVTLTSRNGSYPTVLAFAYQIVSTVSVHEVNEPSAQLPSAATGIFSAEGIRLPALQKGLNIVRQADGTVRKVFVKE